MEKELENKLLEIVRFSIDQQRLIDEGKAPKELRSFWAGKREVAKELAIVFDLKEPLLYGIIK
jgi:hypothetical protein